MLILKRIYFSICTVLASAGSFVSAQTVQPPPALPPVPPAPRTQQEAAHALLNMAGTIVHDASGQTLGRMEQLVLSPEGQIEMLVVNVGNNRVVPVPWQFVEALADASSQAKATAGSSAVQLKLDRSQFNQAPKFQRNQVSQLTTPTLQRQIYAFYGTQPRSGIGGTSTATERVPGSGSSVNAPNKVMPETNPNPPRRPPAPFEPPMPPPAPPVEPSMPR